MKSVVLALGGGGVKGSAHLGVIRVLKREGFSIQGIAGTSAGGLWGSLYAFGYSPDEIERRMGDSEITALFRRDPADAPSWLGLMGLREMLRSAMGDCRFEDLHLPLAVTAVDMKTARQVVIRSGSVVDAVMATIAVPGVFPSITYQDRLLIDGGVVDPVPVTTARMLAPDTPVVAVVLSPQMTDWAGIGRPRLLSSLSFLSRYIERFRFSQALNVFMSSIDISGALLTDLLLEVTRPEVIIRPAVRGIGLLDNTDPKMVAYLGEQAANLALPQLNQVVTRKARLLRQIKRYIEPQVRLPYTTEVI